MKYRYIGEEPRLLIEFHKEVAPGDVVEVDAPINSALFVPVEDAKPRQRATDKSEVAE